MRIVEEMGWGLKMGKGMRWGELSMSLRKEIGWDESHPVR